MKQFTNDSSDSDWSCGILFLNSVLTPGGGEGRVLSDCGPLFMLSYILHSSYHQK